MLFLNLKKFLLSDSLQKSVRRPSEMELFNLKGSLQHHMVQLFQKWGGTVSPLELLWDSCAVVEIMFAA